MPALTTNRGPDGMDRGLVGKRALVRSSSRGLGFAKALAAEGAQVLPSGRNAERLSKAADAINRRGQGEVSRIAADLSGPNVVDIRAQGAAGHLGGMDILIDIAGGPPAGRMSENGAPASPRGGKSRGSFV